MAKKKRNENKRDLTFDYEATSYFDGIKTAVILILDNTQEKLNQEECDLELLAGACQDLMMILNDQINSYLGWLDTMFVAGSFKIDKREYFKRRSSALSKTLNNMLNKTEIAVIKEMLLSIIMEYHQTSEYHRFDYGASRVLVEFAKRAVIDGLQNNIIKYLVLHIGFGDTLLSYKIEYEDGVERYGDEGKRYPIMPQWIAEDVLYDKYAAYKTSYPGLADHTIKSLATADEFEERYVKDLQKRNMISYRGAIIDYVSVLESELRNLIMAKLAVKDSKKLMLGKICEYLKAMDLEFLSSEDALNCLYKLIEIRNRAGHGEDISYDDFRTVKNIMQQKQLLDYVSWELCDLAKSNKE